MMSSILEKTFNHALSMLDDPGLGSMRYDLQSLENAILGRSTTMEVRKRVEDSRNVVKQKCVDLKLTNSEKRYCMRMIIHLGNLNAILPSSVYPFVIKFIEDSHVFYDKLLGHIAVRILNKEGSPIAYIAINTLRKDLYSKNRAVVLMAMTTLASIVDLDMIPVFLPYVNDLFNKTTSSSVKCKALLLLEVMHCIGPEYLPNIWEIALRSLCDRDPHVMSASLPLLLKLFQKLRPPDDSKICEKLIFILKQILDGRVPLHMMHSGISAPWEIIRILKVLRSVPATYFPKGCFTDIATIIEQLLCRLQIVNVTVVAIASECIQVFAQFYSELGRLEKTVLNTLGDILDSQDPNIRHLAMEMLTRVRCIRPGTSRIYQGAVLHMLSDTNPSSFHITVGLVDDLVSYHDNECKELTENLLSILKNMNRVDFKKKIILAILQIFECSLCKKDSSWLIKNYKDFTQSLRTEFDFTLLHKITDCMKLTPLEIMKEELATIANVLNQENVTPLQYCISLEIFLSYHEEVSEEFCVNMITNIPPVLPSIRSKPYYDDILLYSWRAGMEIADQHNVDIDKAKLALRCQCEHPVMLDILFREVTYLLSERDQLKMVIVSSEDISNPDLDLKSLMISPQAEISTHSDSDNSSLPTPVLKSVPAFRTLTYSESPLDGTNAVTHLETAKATFLNTGMLEPVPEPVWSSQKYNSATSCNDQKS